MAKIMQIVPSDILNTIDGREMYMCLTNVAIHNEQYLQFYKQKSEQGCFVLLDNGTGDLDFQSMEKVWEVAEKINPTEIILSDILGDCNETLKQSEISKKFYREKGYKGQFMFVPQGKDFIEWCRCYDMFDKKDVSTIGISKFVTRFFNDDLARLKCVKRVEADNIAVHLLGCERTIDEVYQISKQCNNVRSSDSAICYIYAMNNKKVNDGRRPEGKIDFDHSVLTNEQLDQLHQNIDLYDQLMSC